MVVVKFIIGLDLNPLYLRREPDSVRESVENAAWASLSDHPEASLFTTNIERATCFPSKDSAMRQLGRIFPESRFSEDGDLHLLNGQIADIDFPEVEAS